MDRKNSWFEGLILAKLAKQKGMIRKGHAFLFTDYDLKQVTV